MNAASITPMDEFINLYINNLDLITENSAEVLNAHRQSALENFKLIGFPSPKSEKYKYTKVENLFRTDFEK
ncbi:MAG TPA: hypothetical protein ENN24_06000, partial [Bacteroidetes bacterium]|nr:hypothetical protein [Bacteroidota bacterium]